MCDMPMVMLAISSITSPQITIKTGTFPRGTGASNIEISTWLLGPYLWWITTAPSYMQQILAAS